MNIIFMGTPEFAVPSLKILLETNHKILAVVTTPDKLAGRGLKPTPSPVKIFATENDLKILQPEKFTDSNFINDLQELKPDLQIVVAFKKLPEIIWTMPKYGTINLHASLLPNYRGAAPINWAIMNGEKQTGLTTFYINNEIDTGNIILQETIDITDTTTAGSLYEQMMFRGSKLLIQTLETISEGKTICKEQGKLINLNEKLKTAPKIKKEDCRLNWNENSYNIYNKVRGLSPYPTAYTELISPTIEKQYIKVFSCTYENIKHSYTIGQIFTDQKSYIKIATTDGFISLLEVQLNGRKKMDIVQFLRGFSINNEWKV